MPPRRRQRQPRRVSRRRAISRRYYDEMFTFSLQTGHTALVKVSNLSQRPHSSCFRPATATVHFSGGFTISAQPAESNQIHPGLMQIAYRNPSGERVCVSRPVMSGPNPRTVVLRYPRSADWWPENNSASDVILDIDAICLQASNSTQSTTPAFIYGYVTIRVLTGPEFLAVTCPSLETIPCPRVLASAPGNVLPIATPSELATHFHNVSKPTLWPNVLTFQPRPGSMLKTWAS